MIAAIQPHRPVRVSVVIKALNEERNIRSCIESALAAIAPVGGEVVLADSLSTDRTVDIASEYPITIVQLINPEERCCGIGPQLGYRFIRGEYVYILDGDMRMHASFIEEAVRHLDADARLAGVGGLVVELNTESLEYKGRIERATKGHMQPGIVDRLDMGGLYRRSAIESVGYLSDRNLHSYEEIDLGLRLRAAGWQLRRIDRPSVDHRGHDVPAMQLLRRRWKTRYIRGAGEVLRGSLRRPHFATLLHELKELRIYAGTLLWWLLTILPIVLLPSTTAKLAATAAWLSIPVAAMSMKKRSLNAGCYSFVSWTAHAAGTLLGLMQRRTEPQSEIECRLLRRAP